MDKDIRWKQRLDNLNRAVAELEKSLGKDETDSVIRSGIIKNFEIAFELSWKVMKDRLEAGGTIANSPREIIKAAFGENLISDAEIWIDALLKRNLMAHIYDEAMAKQALDHIKEKYFIMIKNLKDKLENEQ